MFHRILNPSVESSFFLFGPRGTGKTTFLKRFFKNKISLYLDLLDPILEDRYRRNPMELENQLEGNPSASKWVAIDEVQKIPKLLDVVHRIMEAKKIKFILTGSSARKLKRGGSNLLAGRAFVYKMYPLTAREIGKGFSLADALRWGTLPRVFELNSDEGKMEYLNAYSLTYLKEEIQTEQVVRKLDPFREFLEVAAQGNGKIINFNSIARDVGVDTKTVQNYYQILEDTLVGFFLQPYHRSVRKRQRANPKFYLFDSGIRRALDRTLPVPVTPQTYEFGYAFEHWVMAEIHRLMDYNRLQWRATYLRTREDAEIDLILDRPGMPTALVEIKSSKEILDGDLSSLIAFSPDFSKSEKFCLSLDQTSKKIRSIWCLPWEKGLVELGL